MWSVFKETRGMQNKLAVLWKGPGWAPGKPRTGLIEDIPDVSIFLDHLNSPVHLYVCSHVDFTVVIETCTEINSHEISSFYIFFYKIYVGKYILEMTIKKWILTDLICHCLFFSQILFCERIGFIIVQNFYH